MFGLFKRKKPQNFNSLEEEISTLKEQAESFKRNTKEIKKLQLGVALIGEYNTIRNEINYLANQPHTQENIAKALELKARLEQLNNLKNTLYEMNSIKTDNTSEIQKQKKTKLEGADYNPLLQKNPSKRIERTNSEPTMLPSEKKMLETKKTRGAKTELYNGKKPIKTGRANFDPKEYNMKKNIKTPLEEATFVIDFENKNPHLSQLETSKEFRILPITSTETLENIINTYQYNSRQKFIEKEKRTIKKLKVDRTIYEGFLQNTNSLINTYLNIDKGKIKTTKRRQFENLEVQVEKILEEAMFKLESKLNPVYTTIKDHNLIKKYTYKPEENFEKQYNRLLHSSLKNFEGKKEKEKRISKAKALTQLLGQYIALNTEKQNRKKLIEYSRKINSYIKKHVKEEKIREELKIKTTLEEGIVKVYTQEYSAFTYRLEDQTKKIIFGKYKLKKDKYAFVKEGKTTRQKINEIISNVTVAPGYLIGGIITMAGKGVEELGKIIKKEGKATLYGSEKIADALSQPYGIELKKLPRKN